MVRIVHLALADARGHLMRAHVLRGLLQQSGIEVDIVTTQQAGADFLAALGTPSVVLPGRFRMELDERHRLRVGRTRRRFVRYALVDLGRDVAALAKFAAGADLVINDSFHPALLAAHHFLPQLRVVHLHGDNLKRTVIETSQPFHVERWLAHGFGEIIHTLDAFDTSAGSTTNADFAQGRFAAAIGYSSESRPLPGAIDRRRVRVPPLVAALSGDDVRDGAPKVSPTLCGEEPLECRVASEAERTPGRLQGTVRARLGLPASARLAAVYLNPHYCDPAIAGLVERACAERGLVLSGISEAFAGRPGWRAADASFIDVVAAADVFISGAGMGALEQARVTATPLICLLGQQDEQKKNVVERGLTHVQLGHAGEDAATAEQLRQALMALPEKRARTAHLEIARVHALWTKTFEHLLQEAHRERAEQVGQHHRPRDRNQQPAGRRRRERPALAGAAAAPPERPDRAAQRSR